MGDIDVDKASLPYLVLHAKGSVIPRVAADSINAIITIYITRHSHSISIPIIYKLIISMILINITLFYGIFNKFMLYKRSKTLSKIRQNPFILQLHFDFLDASHTMQQYKKSQDQNKKPLCCVSCIVTAIIFVVAFCIIFIGYTACLQHYKGDHSSNHCSIKQNGHILAWFLLISAMLPLCLYYSCLKVKPKTNCIDINDQLPSSPRRFV